MSTERDKEAAYISVIRESQSLAYQLGGDPDLLETIATQVIGSILDAITKGISREVVEEAIEKGFGQGELQCLDHSLNSDYWIGIQQEADDFWGERNALSDGKPKNV